jgi:class 3 adenylate cyclase/CheY-like chemotaxis protein
MTTDRGVVMVVDDDRMTRTLLVHGLNRAGYDTVTAESGEQALALLSEPHDADAKLIDVVLLDVVMPGMDGFAVLERLKADPRTRFLPVIMVSAVDDVAGVVRGIEVGAEDYLTKPVDPVLLRARVNASLARKRLHDLEVEYHRTVTAHAADLEQINAELERRVQEQVGELERLGRLRRFLSPQLAELVVSSGDETILAVHRRQIAVLFCDLRGFTAFSETAAPEQVTAVLEEFHTTFGALARQFEATVGFFAGDAVMVFFNDPLPCSEPAARAVELACALRAAMTGPLRTWRRLDYELDFGIGIALGYATLGQMGFEGRYDYTAIGPVVNLASRLCDQARDGADVLIDQLAHAAVEDLVDVEPLGRFTLKGFTRPRAAYRVVGLRGPDADGHVPCTIATPT